MNGWPARALSWILVLSIAGACAVVGAQEPATPDDPTELEFRTWTDSTGQFSTEAAMLRYEGGNVFLKRKQDGLVVAVPVVKLSARDRLYVTQELRRRLAAAGTPPTGSTGTSSPAGQWFGWRGPNREGKSPDRGLLAQWPAEGPKLLWQADGIGKGYSTVAVANGTVYTTGDTDDQLVIFTFDLDGNRKWQAQHDAAWTRSHPGSRSTPMIDAGNLYLVSGNGQVGCYDAANGQPKWSVHMRDFGGKTPGWGYAESVLIHGDLAVITPGGENCIVALNKLTGKPVWTSQGFRAGAQYGSCYAFTYEGVPMIATGTAEGIVCVDARNGRLLWSNAFCARNTANCPTPVFSDGHVFWANGYGKGGICLKLAVEGNQVTAREAWRTGDMVCHHGGYIMHEGYLYGNHSGGWVCLELRTGQKMWEERGVGKGSLCFADGMLYLFGESGGKAGLATCSPQGMEMRGTFNVAGDGPSWAHPVVIGGRLYLRYDTHLYCFDVLTPTGR